MVSQNPGGDVQVRIVADEAAGPSAPGAGGRPGAPPPEMLERFLPKGFERLNASQEQQLKAFQEAQRLQRQAAEFQKGVMGGGEQSILGKGMGALRKMLPMIGVLSGVGGILALVKSSTIMKTTLGSLFQILGALVDIILMPLAPILARGLQALAKLVTWMTGFIQDPVGWLRQKWDTVIEKISSFDLAEWMAGIDWDSIITKFVEVAGEVGEILGGGIIDILGAFGQMSLNTWKTIGNLLKGSLSLLWQDVKKTARDTWDWVVYYLKLALSKIPGFGKLMGEPISPAERDRRKILEQQNTFGAMLTEAILVLKKEPDRPWPIRAAETIADAVKGPPPQVPALNIWGELGENIWKELRKIASSFEKAAERTRNRPWWSDALSWIPVWEVFARGIWDKKPESQAFSKIEVPESQPIFNVEVPESQPIFNIDIVTRDPDSIEEIRIQNRNIWHNQMSTPAFIDPP